jgi:hypothetical protein
MADRRRNSGKTGKTGSSGRVTPKGKQPPPAPNRRRINPDEPVQVGRRPSSAGFLLLVSVMWVAVGIIVLFTLHTTWKLIPGIVFIGIGLMFFRGFGSTVIRRQQRQPPAPRR